MLKALELFGFKSFADRTRFEFPKGITAIVGPNGAGKSNVVDAIKWVLGEQSVKSLRGQEMADVIFNGSSTRRPMNAAEITLVLDNSFGVLPIEATEVSITRRFYRDGEGEYLLNHQPCRLRDIRDLLGGTGLGTSAYCVIEQGKVDSLLQASLRDRRTIFEEAAGISRFRAKRAEALRRLERVEQNLLRLRDIVEEVESRLKTLRIQAGRARRFRELEAQLQDCRTQLAVADWRMITTELDELRAKQAELEQSAAELKEEITGVERALADQEELLRQAERGLREEEARHAAALAHLSALWDRWPVQWSQVQEIENQRAHLRKDLAQCLGESFRIESHLATAKEGLKLAGLRKATADRELEEALSVFAQLAEEIDNNQNHIESLQEQSRSCGETLAELDRKSAVLRTRLEAITARKEDLKHQELRLQEAWRQAESEAHECQEHLAILRNRLRETEQILGEKRSSLSDREAEASRKREQLARAERELAATHERIKILEELLARFEGVSPGVQFLLREKQLAPDSPLQAVWGLFADGITAAPEVARLVEIALGGKSHYLVARPTEEFLNYLVECREGLEGPAEILWLDSSPDWPPLRPLSLEDHPGVIGRADSLVEAAPEIAPLVRRLLGGIWVVDRWERALVLWKSLGTGVSFLTLAGEWVGGDGSLVIGPPRWAPGVLSRRIELRTLQENLTQLTLQITLLQQELGSLSEETRVLADAIENLGSQRTELVGQIAAAEKVLEELSEREAAIRSEEKRLQEEMAELSRQEQNVCCQLADLAAEMDAVHQQTQRLSELLTDRRADQERCLLRRTELEQQVASLRKEAQYALEAFSQQAAEVERLQQVLVSLGEHRRRLIQQIAEAFELWRRRHVELLALSAELRETAHGVDVLKEQVRSRNRGLLEQEEKLRELRRSVQELRARSQGLEEQRHQLDLTAQQLTSQLGALASRFRDDFGLDLAQVAANFDGEVAIDRQAIQTQIEETRRKLKNLGNVNLEALTELEQIEARHQELLVQYHDLVRAKETFYRILEKINAASREVFLRTIEEVRVHFADLFRTLFGGGHADILLEEGVDPLEAGVEIVARPPGKEPRSISLLSGGEKTLASVALLLAIFRSRPSPFCVLDEVDAALDEANIDRFIKLLQDFPGCSQFILVTHSKKTMTCAQTIYGVTMQEAGVSRQVSVRFEDVTKEDWTLEHASAQPGMLVSEPTVQTEAA